MWLLVRAAALDWKAAKGALPWWKRLLSGPGTGPRVEAMADCPPRCVSAWPNGAAGVMPNAWAHVSSQYSSCRIIDDSSNMGGATVR